MSDDLKFTVQRPPAYGELTDLLPGIFWVRLPMPTIPNHVNCWLLDDGPGWTLVDCGLNTDDTFEIWDKLWRGLLRARPLQNLVLTHAHLDHCGLAGYLVKEMKCAVRLAQAEWLSGWKAWHEREEGADEQFTSFMKRNGASDEDAAGIMAALRRSKYLGLRPPREFIRIRDKDVIVMGQREWTGHHGRRAFTRTCVVLLREGQDPDLGRSGPVAHDTVGDRVVGAAGGQSRCRNTWIRWRGSRRCQRIRWCCRRTACPFARCISGLPSYANIIWPGLTMWRRLSPARTTAFAIAQEVFPRVLYDNPRQAFGESLAHLNMLASIGKLTRDVNADGAIAFAPGAT